METMNISLPENMAAYVRRTVERDYGNASKFFREMVRQRMQREIGADLQFLADNRPEESGPSEEQVVQILATQRQVRKERKEAKK